MKKWVVFIIILLVLMVIVFLIRLLSEKQLDDVSPEIQCNENLMKKADIYYIIPKLNNKSIAENKEWCEQILNYDKKLAMHGIYHTYQEFLENRDEEYLQQGIDIFKQCFGFYPKEFKPPQMKISKDNKRLIKSKMKLISYFNQILHKIYHCNDTGKFSNKFNDLF